MKARHLKTALSLICPLLVVGFLYLNGYPDDHSVFMNGRVADKHSYMENKCMKCHDPWKGVRNDACIKCHVDDRHYMRNKLNPDIASGLRCFDCHQEHRGKAHDLGVAEYLPPTC